MSNRKLLILLIAVLSCSKAATAQTVSENTGWLAFFNTTKFSPKWGIQFDAQFRSSNDWGYVRNVLIRPGIMYHINPKNNVTAGWAYIGTFNRLDGLVKNSLTENRIWEQYINNMNFKSVTLQNRFRLEQRFIERQSDDVFSQRLRYFVRSIIPLVKQQDTFKRGVYAAIQDEIFFTIQNKEKLNDSFFDQNRAYGAVGYRFSKKVDLEAGYLNQYIKGLNANVSNNVIQLAVYTRF